MQTWVLIAAFVAVLAMLPLAIKWLQQRLGVQAAGPNSAIRIEVGPEGARTWLTLGVTGQTITCLHSAPVNESKLVAVSSSSVRAEGT